MATTNLDDVGTAITTRFKAQFAVARPTYTVYVDNDQPANIDSADRYVLLSINPGDSRLAGLGSPRLFRDWGKYIPREPRHPRFRCFHP